jgi:hypothetical protein
MSTILKITRSIDNDIWKIIFSVDSAKFSETDKQLISKFGEPEINVGGVFLGPVAGVENPDQFTLPDKYLKIRSGLPYVQEFDSRGNSGIFSNNTQIKAEAFQAEFVSRYMEALTALRNNVDGFTGEFLINI